MGDLVAKRSDCVEGEQVKNQNPSYLPNPEQIEAAAKRIRGHWTANDYRKRTVSTGRVRWDIPIVEIPFDTVARGADLGV